MLRNTASKVAWVGRTASMVFGLALVLALIFGVATTALSATGGNFILGKPNSAGSQTSLVGTVTKAAQSALVVVNKGTGSALDLRVTNTNSPPMKVNSSAKVANLNADQLDDLDSAALQRRVSGTCPAGQSIQTIAQDGTVTCETDDDSGAAEVGALKTELGTNDATNDAGGPNEASDPVSYSKVKDIPSDVVSRNADTIDSLNSTDFQRSNAQAGGDLTGSYPNPQIGNGAVSGGLGGEITDNTINEADISDSGGVRGGSNNEVINGSINADDIGTGGVGSDEVANGSLRLVADMAGTSFSAFHDFSSIPAGGCHLASFFNANVFANELPILLPQISLPDGLVFHSTLTSSQLVWLRACNVSNGAIDPGSLQFTFVVLRP